MYKVNSAAAHGIRYPQVGPHDHEEYLRIDSGDYLPVTSTEPVSIEADFVFNGAVSGQGLENFLDQYVQDQNIPITAEDIVSLYDSSATSRVADLETVVAGITASGGISEIVADIPARDAILATTSEGENVWVVDASADANVISGWAVYKKVTGVFVKFAEEESIDITVPTSSATPFISGLVPSKDYYTNNYDLHISAGSTPDSAGTDTLSLDTPITKSIFSSFVEGDNQGGLFTGVTRQNFTTYHVFVIKRDSDGYNDVGFDTDINAANIPSGYTSYKRIFSFYTINSGQLPEFTALSTGGGDLEVTYRDPETEFTTSTTGSTADTAWGIKVPRGIKVKSKLKAMLTNTGTCYVRIFSPQDAIGIAATAFNSVVGTFSAEESTDSNIIDVVTNNNGEIMYRGSANTVTVGFYLATFGWTDYRN